MTRIVFAAAATFAVMIAAFFVRYWRSSRDRLFLLFAAAFTVLSVHWMLLASIEIREHAPHHYALRVVAFLLMAAAIVDKNRR